jgi:hypothetical protein
MGHAESEHHKTGYLTHLSLLLPESMVYAIAATTSTIATPTAAKEASTAIVRTCERKAMTTLDMLNMNKHIENVRKNVRPDDCTN